MAQANFVIVEGAACAPLVENDGVIWYHAGRSHFLSKIGENKEGSTPGQVCCPFIVPLEVVQIVCTCESP
jgi:hypothetical protein